MNLPLSIVRDSGSEEKEETFPKVRHQYVDALYRTLKVEVPEIWLHGEWLRDAGFEISDEVKIVTYQNRILIDLESKGNHNDD